MEQGSTISAQFHRELNRLLDSDRNTRKKGLQKLYESLPWERKETRPQLVKFVEESIIEVILSANILADPIEKCREYALKLLVSYTAQLKKPSGKAASQLGDTAVRQLLVSLMARIETTPFPESAEELRLLVVELLTSLCLHFEPALSSEGCRDVRERMVLTMSRAVCDAFPAVKRSAAELLTLLAGLPMFLPAVKSHTTTILKSLATNVNHQHSKTRLSTLTAMMFIVKVAAGVDESFVHALRSDLSIGNTPTSTSATSHSFYGIMSRALSDRTPLVRKELSSLLAKHLVKPRLLVVGDSFSSQLRRSLSEDDCEIIVLLVLLSGDDIDEVADAATTAIINTFNKHWTPEHSASSSSGAAYEPNLIDDNAELSLRSLPSSSSGHPAIAESAKDALHGGITTFLRSETAAKVTLSLVQSVTKQWTMEGKLQGLRGISAWLKLIGRFVYSSSTDASTEEPPIVSTLLPRLLHILQTMMLHEEGVVRAAAESSAQSVGRLFALRASACSGKDGEKVEEEAWLQHLLPRVLGRVDGGDTAYQRTTSIRLLANVYTGRFHSPLEVSSDSGSSSGGAAAGAVQVQLAILSSLASDRRGLWHQFHSDALLKEAILLLLRAFFFSTSVSTASSNVTDCPQLQRHVAQLYLYCMAAPIPSSLYLAAAANSAISTGKSENVDVAATLVESNKGGTYTNSSDLVRIARQDFTRFVLLQTGPHVESGDGESDEVQLFQLSQYLAPHFLPIFLDIVSPYLPAVANRRDNAEPSHEDIVSFIEPFSRPDVVEPSLLPLQWQHCTIDMLCLLTLLRLCLSKTWEHWTVVMPVLSALCCPGNGQIVAGSVQENMLSYAAQRGEDSALHLTADSLLAYDQRMHCILALEDIVRISTTSGHFWESGRSISESASFLMGHILLPNLVWRVGRVEGTLRKIALAAVYALLKAGSIPRESLVHLAQSTLPVLVSHMDDMDLSPRLMACLSLSVFFGRLGPSGAVGLWDDLGLKDIYPKFIARLDDSQDEVRLAACQLLASFSIACCGRHSGNQTASKDEGKVVGGFASALSGYHASRASESALRPLSDTMLEYIIEQLFLHLDDMNISVQEAVFNTLHVIATQCQFWEGYNYAAKTSIEATHRTKPTVEEALALKVVKKAGEQRIAHRSPKFCDALIAKVEEFLEIL